MGERGKMQEDEDAEEQKNEKYLKIQKKKKLRAI